MKKLNYFFIIILLNIFAILSPSLVLAEGLTLQNIGASTVGGRRISSWTYTGRANPAFSGTNAAGQTVSVSINGEAHEATVTGTNWSFQPTTLSQDGTYTIAISSGDQQINFSLFLATSSTANTATTGTTQTASESGETKGGLNTDTLPTAGGLELTLITLGAGLGLVGFSFYRFASNQSLKD